MYEGVDIELPKVNIPKEEQDPHSKRLLKVCDLWDQDFSEEQIKRARRAYYGAVSYVDDCVGELLETLKDCELDEDTIVIFSGDHGDMLGERGLWWVVTPGACEPVAYHPSRYKMSYFEASVRVPLIVYHPRDFSPHRVPQNVSTLDLLPTMCDLVGTKPEPSLPMDGLSLLPHLRGAPGHDTALAEYAGEGTVAPLVMIRRGPWKFTACPADGPQLFHVERDPLELHDLARGLHKRAGAPLSADDEAAGAALDAFEAEAAARWDFETITRDVLLSQRKRRLVWAALKKGHFTSWDYNPEDDGRTK